MEEKTTIGPYYPEATLDLLEEWLMHNVREVIREFYPDRPVRMWVENVPPPYSNPQAYRAIGIARLPVDPVTRTVDIHYVPVWGIVIELRALGKTVKMTGACEMPGYSQYLPPLLARLEKDYPEANRDQADERKVRKPSETIAHRNFDILKDAEAHMTRKDLAEKYKLTQNTIKGILRIERAKQKSSSRDEKGSHP